METRVLLVEDEDHLARGLCFNLEAEGYEAADRLTAPLTPSAPGLGARASTLPGGSNHRSPEP